MSDYSKRQGESLIRLVCVLPHFVFAGLMQDVQGLHGNGLVVVVKLSHQKFNPPITEELHTGSEEDP